MMCNPEADSTASTCSHGKDTILSTVVQEDDESPRCVVDYYDKDRGETATDLSSTASTTSSSSSRLHLRQLVVELKMELAEALAKVDDLTLANKRLEQERDQARNYVEWLRQSHTTAASRPTTTGPSFTSSTTVNTNESPNRRASDGGAPMLIPTSAGLDEPSSSSPSSSFVREIFQSSISSLQHEAMHTSTTAMHRAGIDNNGDDDQDEEDHIETLHFTEDGQPILSVRDVGRTLPIPTGLSLRTSLRRLSNEICNTIQPLSSEAFPESSETETAAGLPPPMSRRSSMPDLRSRRTSNILAKADRLQQPPSSHPPREDDDQVNTDSAPHRETYREYTVKTIFGKDDTAVRRQQRRDRRRRKSLVSSLQIAQARIAGTSSSSEDDACMGVDISPYLPSEGEE